MRLRPWTSVLLAATLAACGSPPDTAIAPPVPAGAAPNANPYRVTALQVLPIASVAVDSQSSGCPGSRVMDGNLATQWINGGFRNTTAWVDAQLSGSQSVESIGLKTGPCPVGTSYDVQVSSDDHTWNTVLSHQTNTSWNVETKAFPAGTSCAHVRVLWHNSATNPQPHFAVYELTINGTSGVISSPTPMPSRMPSPSPSTRPTPRPSPTHTPTPVPSATTSGGMICPPVKPASGGGTTCYPVGTVFLSGDIDCTIGAGGVYTPSHIYLRPGSTIHFHNIDTHPHTLTGFGGANYDAVIPPGATFGKHWTHWGTWTFHDRMTPNPPTFSVTDDPETP